MTFAENGEFPAENVVYGQIDRALEGRSNG